MEFELAPGLAKLQKNDKRPAAASATAPAPWLLRLPPSGSHGTPRGVAQSFCLLHIQSADERERERAGRAGRLLFPKMFLFSLAKAKKSPDVWAGMVVGAFFLPMAHTDISFVLLSFIIICALS